MKILQVYYEPLISGQTTHVLSLSKGLAMRGHDVTVVLPEVLREVSSEYLSAGVKVVLLPMRKLIWPFGSIIAFVKLLRAENYGIVHVHSQEAGIITRLLTRWVKDQNVFYTPQTIDIRHKYFHHLYTWIERKLSQFTTHIFSVNKVDAERMISWGIPTDKVSIVPNGVDMSKFENPDEGDFVRNQLGLRSEYPVIMQVGRLNPQKNPNMFLHGARYILSKYPEAQLVLIGEGPLLNRIKSEVELLSLKNRVHVLGRVDHAYHCIVAADVVTSTSRWEGLPYSLLEAMAYSKPVVSTAVNGCTEIVINGETGYLVEVGDTLNWAKSVLGLLADPQKAKVMGAAGKQLVKEKYSLTNMITRIEQDYLNN